MIKAEKPHQERYISINESIIKNLTPHAYMIYSVLRLESDCKSECGYIRCKIKFISEETKISARQVSRCLNELESVGLVKRNSVLGEKTTYGVAKTLGYFNNEGVK